MAYVYNTVINVDGNSDQTTFLPCCNTSIAVDYQPQHIQEVYYAPEPPPQIQVVRQRLPDPPPDIIERVVVVPQPKKYVYQVVEVPTKPPPVIQERVVHQTPNAPLCGGTYHVKVPPKTTGQQTRIVKSTSGIVSGAPNLIPSTSFTQPSRVVYTSSSPPPPTINY